MTDVVARRDFFSPIILGLGIALAGAFIGSGFVRARAADRSVSVKGVAEQQVHADLAIWPIRIVAADNDLATAQTHLQANIHGILVFLAAQKIDTSKVALEDFSVADALANQYNNNAHAVTRFVVHQTLVVRSDQPDILLAASQKVGELASAGVTFSSGDEGSGSGPTFIFTGLNQLKPKMIADATARAREGAEQFARDSHSTLGGIRSANQGVFEILSRDQVQGITEASQIDKIVRVVSTVEYYLKD